MCIFYEFVDLEVLKGILEECLGLIDDEGIFIICMGIFEEVSEYLFKLGFVFELIFFKVGIIVLCVVVVRDEFEGILRRSVLGILCILYFLEF